MKQSGFDYDRERYIALNGRSLAKIRMDSHRLEKGFTLPRLGYPYGSEVANRLCKQLEACAENGEMEQPFVRQARSTLSLYCGHLQKCGFQIPEYVQRWAVVDDIAGGEHDGANQRQSNAHLEFIQSRRSIRIFSGDQVPVSLISLAVRSAQTAPSVCNRQTSRVRHYSGDRMGELLALQNGNRGFVGIGGVLVVSVFIPDFVGEKERNQPWIDGGLFSMSLSLSLQALGLGTCFLNWCTLPTKDRELRNVAGIPEEESIITLMAVGYLCDESQATPRSLLPIEEVFFPNC